LDYPSAGSIFKNPAGKPAGLLIEAAGLKGMQIGGAKISERHGVKTREISGGGFS
jgi:UDP-N-acetylmuramate dehydrogenase